MPCDTINTAADEAADYFTEILSVISSIRESLCIHNCIICGDFNSDLSRQTSSHTRSLKRVIEEEGLSLCHDPIIDFTFESKINGSRSCIDHIIVSLNMSESVSEYKVIHRGNNPSDHSMVMAKFNIDVQRSVVDDVYSNTEHIDWNKATHQELCNYKFLLDSLLSSIDVPASAVQCNNLFCNEHGETIEYLHSAIANACISASDAALPTNSKGRGKIIPGWNEQVKLARERAILWHTLWKENHSPSSGLIYEIRRKTRSEYHYALRKLRDGERSLRYEQMSRRVLADNSSKFWEEVKRIRGNSKVIANNVDGVQGDAIADVFANKYNGLYNSVSYDDGEMSILKKDIDVMIHSCYDHSTDVRTPVISVQDVALAVGEMKTGKRDANHMLFTHHLVHGTNRLFVLLSLFFTSAVVHRCIPSEINTSTLVPIPKNTKKSLNDSDNYRAIALSSIFGKLFDKIILKKYSSVFITTDQQFGFKKEHSTTQCNFVVNEVINYFNNKGTSVKVVMLDASKAFDRVHYVKLFRLLLKRNLCPLILRCILNMYVRQRICVKWGDYIADTVSISNGVKQGGVLSPVLFTVYFDVLLIRLKKSMMGCHIGNVFCGALSYADDIILLAPTLASLKYMLSICEKFASDYDVVFNTSKSKSLVFPDSGVTGKSISFMGGVIEHVSDYSHLGYIIGSECDSLNIQCCIRHFYAKLNVLFRDLYYVSFDIKYLLMKTYCMSLYGCPLWELDGKNIEKFYVAWRKGIRRLFGLPNNTHCALLNLIFNDITIDSQIDKRV